MSWDFFKHLELWEGDNKQEKIGGGQKEGKKTN
jgi:hypothetical protein